MKRIHWFNICVGLLLSASTMANNIQISNVTITDDAPLDGYALVSFDLSWQNAWRDQNWDAAWVFVKYRVQGGDWQHASLNNSGHSSGTGTAAVVEAGLRDDKQTFNATANPCVGVMVFRSTSGSDFAISGMKLRWNYGADGITGNTNVEVRVFGVEMVLVPGGVFNVGDGSSTNTLRKTANSSAYQVTTIGSAIKVNTVNSFDDAQIEGTGIWVDGDGGISRSSASATNINADFPTGFRGFYAMKYEISQGQYRDFLNTLTRSQQNLRTATDISGTSITNRYLMSNTTSVQYRNGLRCNATLPSNVPIEVYCDLDGDGVRNEASDGEWIACNFLSWADGAAYLDWCGLRPMTELEYEKICRGTASSVSGEYAWGTNALANAEYTLSSNNTSNEKVAANYSTSSGNAAFETTVLFGGGINGPLRVGIFAADSLNTGRVTSGAGFYGNMELSGNLWERVITLGNTTGRGFTGVHGDGKLGTGGDADVSLWPGTNAVGGGMRGGRWGSGATTMRTSDRFNAARSYSIRDFSLGFRGVRSVASTGSGY